LGIIVVFGKPPLPGVSKTRLGAEIGDKRASEVARALLMDSVARYEGRGASVVVATTDVGADHGVGVSLWDQCDGDLGARVERMLRRGVASGWALAVGADAPHISEDALSMALAALNAGHNVLGPSEDGGFWALGVQQCPPGLLADLPWSAPTTGERTFQRMQDFGLEPVRLPLGWDVDTLDDLIRLSAHAELAPRSAALAC
jgi:uncharacterized protein